MPEGTPDILVSWGMFSAERAFIIPYWQRLYG